MGSRHSIYWSLAVIAGLLTCGSGAFAQHDYHYMHFKDAEPLTLRASEIAVLADSEAAEARLPHALVRFNLDAQQQRLVHAGWRRLPTPAAIRTDEDVRQLITAMAEDVDFSFVSPVFEDVAGPTIVKREAFVQFAAHIAPAQAEAILAAHGYAEILSVNHWNQPNLYKVRSSARNGFTVLEDANALAARADVVFAEPNRIITILPAGQVIPNDPGFEDSWHLHNTGQEWNGAPDGVVDMDMNGPEAWDMHTGNANIVVAVLDNGIQQNHPDLNQVTPGIDETFFNGDGGPLFPLDNHGTAVGGCISAIMNNGIGAVGIAPNCRVRSFKIAYDDSPAEGWTSEGEWVAEGVFDAFNTGCRVTNSSFRMGSSSPVSVAYTATYPAVMHFAAAGNGGDDDIGDPFLNYPASLSVTNAIAALDPDGTLTSFSNWGTGLHFAAPGIVVYTTDRTGSNGYSSGNYTFFGGTSAASPCAAGVAALVFSADPSLDASECGSIMASTTKDLGNAGYDVVYGYGLPRADGALTLAMFGDDCPGTGSCVQDNGTPGCTNASCCFAICTQDPFCCNNNWDDLCAEAAAIQCYGCGNSGAGSCNSANGTPSCNDADCCAAVCLIDPTCCTSVWDSACATLAANSSSCPPPNNTCGNPQTIFNGNTFFSTVGATTNGSAHITCDFCCGDTQIHKDVWFLYTATCTATLTVSTCGNANFDTKIAVYQNASEIGYVCEPFGPHQQLLACNDDAPDCANNGSRVEVAVEAGNQYRIRVGGYNGQSGTGTLNLSCTLTNNTCAGPLPIFEGDTPFSTLLASTDGAEHITCDFCCGDEQIHKDIWFIYTATCDGDLTVSTCGQANFDTKLALYRNTSPGGIGYVCNPFGPLQTLLGCNDDTSGCSGNTSEVTIAVTEGTQYRIRVGGYNGQSGNGTLSVDLDCASVCPGDIVTSATFNPPPDGIVDGADLAYLLGEWGANPGSPADLVTSATFQPPPDGIVDGADLAVLLGAWGACP